MGSVPGYFMAAAGFIWEELFELAVAVLAALLAYFVIGALLRGLDAAHAPGRDAGRYWACSSFETRRAAHTVMIFGLVGGVLFLGRGDEEGMVFGVVFLLIGVGMLLRSLALMARRIEVNEDAFTRRRFLRAPQSYRFSDVDVVSNMGDEVTVYMNNGDSFTYHMGGKAKNNPGSQELLMQLNEASSRALERKRQERGVRV